MDSIIKVVKENLSKLQIIMLSFLVLIQLYPIMKKNCGSTIFQKTKTILIYKEDFKDVNFTKNYEIVSGICTW